MTGKTTTRHRSTRPAASRERHSVRLPSVRSDSSPSSFSARTASTASPAISRLFGHESGSVNVLEKTTFGMRASVSVPGSPSVASVDINKKVFAPSRIVYAASGWSSSHARYSGPSRPQKPGHPSAAPYPSSEVMKSTISSCTCASFRVFRCSFPAGDRASTTERRFEPLVERAQEQGLRSDLLEVATEAPLCVHESVRRGQDPLVRLLRVGDHRAVPACDLDRVRPHPLRELPLGVGRNHLVVL